MAMAAVLCWPLLPAVGVRARGAGVAGRQRRWAARGKVLGDAGCTTAQGDETERSCSGARMDREEVVVVDPVDFGSIGRIGQDPRKGETEWVDREGSRGRWSVGGGGAEDP